MAKGKIWYLDPNSGGIKIPDAVKKDVTSRINALGKKEFAGMYTRLHIFFRGKFCYIDAYTEPVDSPGWPPENSHESKEQYLERLRNTPTHLCRLRYFGQDTWGFAFYTYSNNRYELSVYPDGSFFGNPESAFFISAQVYLGNM